MPEAVEKQMVKSIRRNTEAAARMARSLVPVASGELKGWIHTKYEKRPDEYIGSVEAPPPTQEAQVKARAIEFGRKKEIAAQPQRSLTFDLLNGSKDQNSKKA